MFLYNVLGKWTIHVEFGFQSTERHILKVETTYLCETLQKLAYLHEKGKSSTV